MTASQGTWRTQASDLPIDWPPVPPSMVNPLEGDYLQPGVDDNALATFGSSTNGIAEYTASNFAGELQGDLILASFGGNLERIQLNATGDEATNVSTFASNFGSLPLDVVAQGDDEPFPGTIWAATYGSDNISIFEPADYDGGNDFVCNGVYDFNIDEDGDGYSNAEEIDNGTNPCSASDVPADFDRDIVSDLYDLDDDNDGILDTQDPYPQDKYNGRSTSIPLDYPMLNGDPGTGFYGLGFTGLMSNGTDDYLALLRDELLIPGGTAGVLTIDGVTQTSAFEGQNNQENALQFGIDVNSTSGAFLIHVRMAGDVFGSIIPTDGRSAGAYIGTGDQDNYLMFAAVATSSGPELTLVHENNAVAETLTPLPNITSLTQLVNLNLFFLVDPGLGTVQPQYSIDGGPVTNLGAPIPLSGNLLSTLQGTDALAVGVIASATNDDGDFTAQWDFIDVTPVASDALGDWNNLAPAEPAPPSCECHENAYVKAGNKYYLIGGRGDGRSVQIYDPVVSTWSSGASLPIQMHHFQAVESDGLIYVVGAWTGEFPNEQNLDTVYIYNPAIDSWRVGPAIPGDRNRGSTGAIAYKGKIYVVAGNDGGHNTGATLVSWFDEFDPATGTWTQLADAPRGRDHFQVAIVNDKMYVAGGRDSSSSDLFGSVIGEVDVYDFASNTWDTLPDDIPTKRAGAAAVTYNGEFIVIGGESSQVTAHNEVEALNPQTNTWRSLAPLNLGRHATQAIVDNGAIYIAAGSKTQGANEIGSSEAFFQEIYQVNGILAPTENPLDPGILKASPSSLNFKAAAGLSPQSKKIILSNIGGNQAITVNDITISGYVGIELNIAQSLPAIIAPNQTMTFEVVFDSSLPGEKTGDIYVQHEGANDDLIIPLSGEPYILYRVNAGAGQLSAIDGDPVNWSGDTSASPSSYVNSSQTNNTYSVNNTITAGPSVPSSVPLTLFKSERWDNSSSPEMQWNFPVSNGNYEVRLYFAETFSGTGSPGKRVFDVVIEDLLALDNYDVVAEAGAMFVGVMQNFEVEVTDELLTIDLLHVIENPAIKGIEIISLNGSTGGPVNNAPTITSINDQTNIIEDPVSLQVTASDDDGDTLLYTASGLPAGLSIDLSSGLIAGTITSSADLNSPYAVTVTVTDNGSPQEGANTFFNWTVNAINIAPTITSIIDQTNTVADLISLQVTASDSDGNALSYSASGLPAGLSISPSSGLISGTITSGADLNSPYTVTVTVTDDGSPNKNAQTGFSWIVNSEDSGPTNNAPTINPINNQTHVVADLVSIQAFGSDSDLGDTLSYSATGLPAGLSIDISSGLISGTITSGADLNSPYTVTVTVTDNGSPQESADTSFSWSVNAFNNAPTITSIPDQTNITEDLVSLQVTASDSDSNVLSYSASGLPAGLSIAPTSGLITGTITSGAEVGSPYSVLVTVTDDGSPAKSAEAPFTWTVNSIAQNQPIYRINAGGSQLSAVDGEPVDWSGDTSSSPSSYVNSSQTNNTYSVNNTITAGPSVPSSVPLTLFKSERWDNSSSPEMQWNFPVSNGNYEVRLYFAETFSGAGSPGKRVFDVVIEDLLALDNYDVVADAGAMFVGVMQNFEVEVTDELLTIDLLHVIENPAIKGIEIIAIAESTPNELGSSTSQIDFGGNAIDASGLRAFQLINKGGADDPSITIDPSTATISGLNGDKFGVTFASTNLITLAPGNSTTVTVTFQPTTEGLQSAILNIPHSGNNTSLQIGLTGQGETLVDFNWTVGTPSPIARTEAGGAVINDKIYVFGGFTNTSMEASLQSHVYDPSTDVWTRLADMPAKVTHYICAVDGNTVWIVAGFGGDNPGPAVTQVYKYDIITDSWSQGPDLPLPRGGGGTAVVGRELHYFGGYAADRQTNTADHWVLDLDNPISWTTAADMPSPRGHLGVAVLNDKIYAVGGQFGHDGVENINTESDLVHVYDPATDTWAQAASLLVSRSHNEAGTIVHEGHILVFGGESATSRNINNVSAYNPVTDTWKALPTLPININGVIAAIINNQLFVTTGTINGGTNPQATTYVTPWSNSFLDGGGGPTNNSPTVISIDNQNDTVGDTVGLQVTASDADPGDTLTYSASNLPAGLSVDISSGLISGTITSGADLNSPYTVTVTVTDDGTPNKNAQTGFSWIVNSEDSGPTNNAPTINPINNQTHVVADLVNIQAFGSDSDLGDTLSYSATGLPAGLSIGVSSGLISGTITSGADLNSPYTVTVTVTDDGSPQESADTSFSWSVNAFNNAPTIISIPDQTSVGCACDCEWQTIDDSTGTPTARHEAAYVAMNGEFYLIGGRGTRPLDIYDPATNAWRVGASPPIELHHFQAIVYDNEIWVVGALTGNYPNGTPVEQVYIYNPANNTWRVGPTIDRPRGGGGAFLRDGKIYLVCGLTIGHIGGHVSWFDCYDPSTGLWTQLPDAPRARDHFAAQIVNEKLWLASGRRTAANEPGGLGSGMVAEIDFFDFDIGSWTTLPSELNLPTLRAGTATASIGNQLIVAGGESGSQSIAHNEVEALDTVNLSWRELSPLKDGRHGTSIVAGEGGLYIVAGSGSFGGSPELTSQEFYAFCEEDTANYVSLQVFASDIDGDTLGYSASNLPSGLSISPISGLITGTVTSDAVPNSPYAVTVTVTDDGSPNKSADTSFDWIVNAINNAPAVTLIPDQTNNVADTVNLAVTAADIDLGNTLNYSAAGLPTGLSIDISSGLISGTITSGADLNSPYTVTVTVTDDGTPNKNAQTGFSWMVNSEDSGPTNNAPTINPINNQTHVVADLVNIQAFGSDSDLGDTLSYSATGLPAGLSIGVSSGLISGTITSGADLNSPYAITVTVTDDGSPAKSAEAPFTWIVEALPPEVQVLYRVNAGGSQLSAVDSEPVDWSGDTSSSPSSYVNSSQTNNTYSVNNTITAGPSVPSSVPLTLFKSERWDNSSSPEMQWNFPVSNGNYEVRLYFAETFSGAGSPGKRVFDVVIEDLLALDNYDVVADAGAMFVGVMQNFEVEVTDELLTIDLLHVIENPAIKGIEIIAIAESTPNELGSSTSQIDFGGNAIDASGLRAFQLINKGGADDPSITIDPSTATISGLNGDKFGVTFASTNLITLAPGNSTTVTVTFQPTTEGLQSAILNIPHSGNNTSLQIGLTGQGETLVDFNWTVGTPSPIARTEAGGAVINDKIYVFGGFTNTSMEASLQSHVYDPSTDVWTRLADMPAKVTHYICAVDGNTVWIVAGFGGDNPGPAVTQVYKYDIITDSWSQGPDLPLPRGGGGTAVVGRELHYFGGYAADRQTNTADHWVLDLDNPISWTTAADMPSPRGHLGVAVLNDKIYAVGGQFGHDGVENINTESDLVHVYDPATDTWAQAASLLVSRSHNEAGTIVHEGHILVFGGESATSRNINNVSAYNPVTDTWKALPTLPININGVIAAIINNQLFVTTGTINGGTNPQATTYVTPWSNSFLDGAPSSSPQLVEQGLPDDSPSGTTQFSNYVMQIFATDSYDLEIQYNSSQAETVSWELLNTGETGSFVTSGSGASELQYIYGLTIPEGLQMLQLSYADGFSLEYIDALLSEPSSFSGYLSDTNAVTGNFQLLANVQELVSSGARPEVGIIIEEPSSGASRFVQLGIQLDQNYYARASTDVNGSVEELNTGLSGSFPNAWILLERTGDQISMAVSSDNVSYQLIQVITLPSLPDTLDAGLYIDSGSENIDAKATLQNFEIIPLP